MTTKVTLRIILPIDKKPDVKYYLSSTYPGWTLLVLRAFPEKDTLEMTVQLPPTVKWTEKDEVDLKEMCRGETRHILFWDRVFGEVPPHPSGHVISELLSALQGLVGEADALQAAYAFHSRSQHNKRSCPVCLAKRLYDAYR